LVTPSPSYSSPTKGRGKWKRRSEASSITGERKIYDLGIRNLMNEDEAREGR
jgi:hypothetical protein